MKRNVVVAIVLVGLFIVASGLYAQNNVILKQGVNRSNFETWTIIDTETFEDSIGVIWVWVRAKI